MDLQLTLIIASVLSTTYGLSLTKSTTSSCVGEEVVFTCTITEGSSLSWSLVVTRDSNIPTLTHTFAYHHYREQSRRMKTWSQVGFRVELELVSVEPVFVSTLATNLREIIIDARVTCQQSFQAQTNYITLASIYTNIIFDACCALICT